MRTKREQRVEQRFKRLQNRLHQIRGPFSLPLSWRALSMHNLYKRGSVWWGRVVVDGREFRKSMRTEHEDIAKRAVAKWALELKSPTFQYINRRKDGPTLPKRRTVGIVYGIGYADKIKIGWVKEDLATRLSALQVSSPEDLRVLARITGGRDTERYLHKKFAEHRIRGEWFFNRGPVCDWVRQNEAPTVAQFPTGTVDSRLVPIDLLPPGSQSRDWVGGRAWR
jgi:hypothetical protein